MEKCPLCKGEKKKGTTTYTADLKTGIVIIRQVPCSVCVQCGEEWIGAAAAKKIEEMVEEAKVKKTQTEIIDYSAVEKEPAFK